MSRRSPSSLLSLRLRRGRFAHSRRLRLRALLPVPVSGFGWVILAIRLIAAGRVIARLARAGRPLPPLTPAAGAARPHSVSGASTAVDASLAGGSLPSSTPTASIPPEIGSRGAAVPAPFGDAAGTPGPGSITVVIPARDEAGRIGPCLEALVGAPGVVEVVVVDDRSTDATAEIAAAAGARVITGAPLPSGWAGKAWALDQGLRAANGDWVVTLDADTRPDARLPQALVARMATDGYGFATVAGRFDCPTAGSRWLHPALLTTLVYRFGPPGDGNQLANGQCMAGRRTDWLAAGGMTAVAGHVVEDVALARHLADSMPVGFLDGAALLTVRMFETFAETWSGWGRSIALPGVESPTRQVAHATEIGATQALPLLRVLARRADLVDGVLLACRLGTLVGTRRAYARADAAYWASPLADSLAALRLAWSIIRPPRTWRGRTYPT